MSKKLGVDILTFGYLESVFAVAQLLGGVVFGRLVFSCCITTGCYPYRKSLMPTTLFAQPILHPCLHHTCYCPVKSAVYTTANTYVCTALFMTYNPVFPHLMTMESTLIFVSLGVSVWTVLSLIRNTAIPVM